MLENYNKYNLLKIFFDNPNESFRLRELSRLSKISPPSVITYLKEFEKQNLIEKYEKRDIPFYKAQRENKEFKLFKKISIIYELDTSGLTDYLYDKITPDSIILFGSASLGEDIEKSDIDIFIQAENKKLDLKNYEKKLNKKINLFFESKFSRLNNELKNNIINGIILRGYLKVF